jgi:hypothetical protein
MAGKAFFIMRLNDHVQYLKKLEDTLHGKGDFAGTDHTECKLGQWIFGEGEQEVVGLNNPQAKEVFDSIKDPHERFHTISKEALAKQQAGDEAGAKAASTEMHVLSTNISNKLLELDKLG